MSLPPPPRRLAWRVVGVRRGIAKFYRSDVMMMWMIKYYCYGLLYSLYIVYMVHAINKTELNEWMMFPRCWREQTRWCHCHLLLICMDKSSAVSVLLTFNLASSTHLTVIPSSHCAIERGGFSILAPASLFFCLSHNIVIIEIFHIYCFPGSFDSTIEEIKFYV